jgi:hypothetical protein
MFKVLTNVPCIFLLFVFLLRLLNAAPNIMNELAPGRAADEAECKAWIRSTSIINYSSTLDTKSYFYSHIVGLETKTTRKGIVCVNGIRQLRLRIFHQSIAL